MIKCKNLVLHTSNKIFIYKGKMPQEVNIKGQILCLNRNVHFCHCCKLAAVQNLKKMKSFVSQLSTTSINQPRYQHKNTKISGFSRYCSLLVTSFFCCIGWRPTGWFFSLDFSHELWVIWVKSDAYHHGECVDWRVKQSKSSFKLASGTLPRHGKESAVFAYIFYHFLFVFPFFALSVAFSDNFIVNPAQILCAFRIRRPNGWIWEERTLGPLKTASWG